MKPTQEQVIAWAREVGWQYAENDNSGYEPLWRAMRFTYEAGRKDENEACAEVCERLAEHDMHGGVLGRSLRCAAAIRARIEQ